MSSRVSVAVATCEHWVGHETAHLAPAEQIEACERLIASWTATIAEIKAEHGIAAACEDCPPIGYPTNKTRCAECPRMETRARNIEHTAAHDCACDECVKAETIAEARAVCSACGVSGSGGLASGGSIVTIRCNKPYCPGGTSANRGESL